jgi:hypothetical protein
VVNATPRKDPVPIAQETVWVLGLVWTGEENLAKTEFRSPDYPAYSKSLYRPRYPGQQNFPGGEWNPDLPRDRRGYEPRYC